MLARAMGDGGAATCRGGGDAVLVVVALVVLGEVRSVARVRMLWQEAVACEERWKCVLW